MNIRFQSLIILSEDLNSIIYKSNVLQYIYRCKNYDCFKKHLVPFIFDHDQIFMIKYFN